MSTGTDIATTSGSPLPETIERVLIEGDLSPLKPAERVVYYNRVCESVGLNPLTKPFEYLKLNGRLILYARRDCTDQLRAIHKVSVSIVGRERTDDLIIVTARATMADGRTDESVGAVSIAGARGENLANALMKSETKAKRRVTLSICGLGIMDETEIEDAEAEAAAASAPGRAPSDAPVATLKTDWGSLIDACRTLPDFQQVVAKMAKDATDKERAENKPKLEAKRAALRESSKSLPPKPNDDGPEPPPDWESAPTTGEDEER